MRPQAVTLTPKDIETEWEEGAVAGTVWRALWLLQARTYGFIDLDGRVLPWAKPYQVAARRGYVRGRRFLLEG
jgi:hypothetical protein